MKYLLYLPGSDSGRAICLKEASHMVNTHRIVGGEGGKGSYYARECGTYEMKPLGAHHLFFKRFGNDVPKSIETESFPSSEGTR